jgi:hypothetical protein
MRFRFAAGVAATFAAVVLFGGGAFYGQSSTFFQEGFEDSGLGGRGWYDLAGPALSTSEHYSGSRSFECRFTPGGTKCGTVGRHLFADSDSVYVSFYIKHSASWVGSGKPYHPHMFLLLTNQDTAYAGPAYSYLTGYIEEIGGVPNIGIQDGRNIDETRIGQDLTGVTEQRAVAGCNGDSDGYGAGGCYQVGTVHWNAKLWSAGQMFFENAPGPRYKGDWHLVESYFRLNSIVGGKGMKDGILRYWYDGNLIINHTNVVLRTGAQSAMKFNQFQVAPWIGDGSPVDQTFWVDDLIVASDRPAVPPSPPNGGSSGLPSAPQNLRIVP